MLFKLVITKNWNVVCLQGSEIVPETNIGVFRRNLSFWSEFPAEFCFPLGNYLKLAVKCCNSILVFAGMVSRMDFVSLMPIVYTIGEVEFRGSCVPPYIDQQAN